ncbi:MAG: M28 family peptidase, partial [Gemmatimonadales bacterium]
RELVYLSLNAAALGKVIEGSGRDAAALIEAGSTGKPLPSFDLADRLRARFRTAERTFSSPNVIGILPGTDPSKADEAIVLSAHLDAYGYGEPVDGDSLYNGTLDDAAYVALLVRLAERRAGKGFRRPLVFAIVTGEEKGLLGSRWFLSHLTLPKERIAANVNLDQLRPLFPLELLTVHALDETTLGDDARAVATGLGITVQNDPEPERRLLMRSDHWTFIQAGIPAINFVFGFRPGTESERIYRRWYREGYHTPQDDLAQAIDWKAAADFNRFFYGLVDRVADQDATPAWKPDSKLQPKAN